MTIQDDAIVISTALMLLVGVPSLLRAIIIGLPVLQGIYLSRTELEPALFFLIIGFGSALLSVLIVIAGAFIMEVER